jgi:hypothetical protein
MTNIVEFPKKKDTDPQDLKADLANMIEVWTRLVDKINTRSAEIIADNRQVSEVIESGNVDEMIKLRDQLLLLGATKDSEKNKV